jgi:hypothetical protein
MQSVPITEVVSSNLDQGEMYTHYVIKFVSDLGQVGGFLWVHVLYEVFYDHFYGIANN